MDGSKVYLQDKGHKISTMSYIYISPKNQPCLSTNCHCQQQKNPDSVYGQGFLQDSTVTSLCWTAKIPRSLFLMLLSKAYYLQTAKYPWYLYPTNKATAFEKKHVISWIWLILHFNAYIMKIITCLTCQLVTLFFGPLPASLHNFFNYK